MITTLPLRRMSSANKVLQIVNPSRRYELSMARGERGRPKWGKEGMNILVEDLIDPILQRNRRKERPGSTMMDDFLSWLVLEEELLPGLLELCHLKRSRMIPP